MSIILSRCFVLAGKRCSFDFDHFQVVGDLAVTLWERFSKSLPTPCPARYLRPVVCNPFRNVAGVGIVNQVVEVGHGPAP
jgi:hypothetical protein